MNAAVSHSSVRPSVLHSNGMADSSPSVPTAAQSNSARSAGRLGIACNRAAITPKFVSRRHTGREVIDHAPRPAGKGRMQPVEHAVGHPAVFDHAERAQRGQMAGHLRLRDSAAVNSQTHSDPSRVR